MTRRGVFVVAALVVAIGAVACHSSPVRRLAGAGKSNWPGDGPAPTPTMWRAPTPIAKALGAPAPRLGMGNLGVYWQKRDQNALQDFRGNVLPSLRGGVSYQNVNWCTVQLLGNPTAFNWAPADNNIDAQLAAGVRVYLRVRIGTCNSVEAQGSDAQGPGGSTPSGWPTDPTAYKGFLKAMTTHYAAKGVHVYAIENEVEAKNFWAGTPSEYERLVEVAAPVIRSADPNATVVDGGVAAPAYANVVAADLLAHGREQAALDYYNGINARRFGPRSGPAGSIEDLQNRLSSPTARNDQAFIDAIFDLERRGVVDAYQLHYYEPYGEVAQTLAYIRAHNGGLPIDAWETGFHWAEGFDAETMANEIPLLYHALFEGGVRSAIFLPLQWHRTPEEVRGLYEQSGRPRAALEAFLTLVRKGA